LGRPIRGWVGATLAVALGRGARGNPPQGDHKGPPCHSPPPSPLRMTGSAFVNLMPMGVQGASPPAGAWGAPILSFFSRWAVGPPRYLRVDVRHKRISA